MLRIPRKLAGDMTGVLFQVSKYFENLLSPRESVNPKFVLYVVLVSMMEALFPPGLVRVSGLGVPKTLEHRINVASGWVIRHRVFVVV